MGTTKITVERLLNSDLGREIWEFHLTDFPQVWLESYAKQERSSPTHPWGNTGPTYLRSVMSIPWSLMPLSWLSKKSEYLLQEPKIPDDVLNEAIEKLQSMIVVTPWEDC